MIRVFPCSSLFKTIIMAERIRLTYFTDAQEMGGAEEYLYLLIEGLDRSQYDIRFVCTNDQALAPLIDRLCSLNVDVKVISAHRGQPMTRLRVRQTLTLWRFFRRHPTDILHVNLPDPYACRWAIIVARLAGVPIIVTTNHLPTLSPNRFTWKGQLILLLAQECVDRTIVESEINRQAALNNYKLDPTKTVTVYHGIDVKNFESAVDREGLRQELGLGPTDLIIGTVGRLTSQKAQHIFLEAAALVKQKLNRAKFILVGEGERRSELEQRARELGCAEAVVFTGYRRDIPALLGIFDVFVLSSLFEGLPLSILEAMATAKPVIATSVDGIPEVVIDGETGMLVPPRDPQALAEAILFLGQHPSRAQAMGLAGRHRVETRFRQQVMVAQTKQLYAQLLTRGEIGTAGIK